MGKANVSTRFRITMAMDRLCHYRPYDDIPIADICTEAGVSHSSFYRAFENKYAIALWFQSAVLCASLGEIGRSFDWRDGLMRSFDGWHLAPALCTAAARCTGYESIVSNYHRQARACMLDTLCNVKGVELTRELAFQLDYFNNTGVLLGDEWKTTKSDNTALDIVSLMIPCIPRDLYAALEQPANPKPYRPLTISELMAYAEDEQADPLD